VIVIAIRCSRLSMTGRVDRKIDRPSAETGMGRLEPDDRFARERNRKLFPMITLVLRDSSGIAIARGRRRGSTLDRVWTLEFNAEAGGPAVRVPAIAPLIATPRTGGPPGPGFHAIADRDAVPGSGLQKTDSLPCSVAVRAESTIRRGSDRPKPAAFNQIGATVAIANRRPTGYAERAAGKGLPNAEDP
jgi:hypothetical protein